MREWVQCETPHAAFVHERGQVDIERCYVTSRPGEPGEPRRPEFVAPCITDFHDTPKTCACGAFDLR